MKKILIIAPIMICLSCGGGSTAECSYGEPIENYELVGAFNGIELPLQEGDLVCQCDNKRLRLVHGEVAGNDGIKQLLDKYEEKLAASGYLRVDDVGDADKGPYDEFEDYTSRGVNILQYYYKDETIVSMDLRFNTKLTNVANVQFDDKTGEVTFFDGNYLKPSVEAAIAKSSKVIELIENVADTYPRSVKLDDNVSVILYTQSAIEKMTNSNSDWTIVKDYPSYGENKLYVEEALSMERFSKQKLIAIQVTTSYTPYYVYGDEFTPGEKDGYVYLIDLEKNEILAASGYHAENNLSNAFVYDGYSTELDKNLSDDVDYESERALKRISSRITPIID